MSTHVPWGRVIVARPSSARSTAAATASHLIREAAWGVVTAAIETGIGFLRTALSVENGKRLIAPSMKPPAAICQSVEVHGH
jgi:hypothetical protein